MKWILIVNEEPSIPQHLVLGQSFGDSEEDLTNTKKAVVPKGSQEN